MPHPHMRLQNKLMSPEEAMGYLQSGDYGILSTISPDNQCYGIPLSYATTANTLYIHGATIGHKVGNIAHNPHVCFTVVSEAITIPEKLTVHYKSVMAFGTMTTVSDPDEKREALLLLCDKYAKGLTEVAENALNNDSHRTIVWKLQIETLTGKDKTK